MVIPERVSTVRDSKPLRMVLEGESTASTSCASSGLGSSFVKSGPRPFVEPSTRWHLVQAT